MLQMTNQPTKAQHFKTDTTKHELAEMKVNQPINTFVFEIDNMVTEIKTIGQI